MSSVIAGSVSDAADFPHDCKNDIPSLSIAGLYRFTMTQTAFVDRRAYIM